jgi:LruC domain-containing protein
VTDDDTNPAIGKYYQSKTNLPWGIHISGEFDYPIEKVPVTEAYTKFIYWIQSAGAQFPDWFMDKPGYRIPENIY